MDLAPLRGMEPFCGFAPERLRPLPFDPALSFCCCCAVVMLSFPLPAVHPAFELAPTGVTRAAGSGPVGRGTAGGLPTAAAFRP